MHNNGEGFQRRKGVVYERYPKLGLMMKRATELEARGFVWRRNFKATRQLRPGEVVTFKHDNAFCVTFLEEGKR